MTTNEQTGPVRCPTGETGPTERMISWPPDMPGWEVDGMKFRNHWHVQAARDGARPITGVGRTYEDALAAVKRHYNEMDGWPLGPDRLDPHRTVAPAAWRGPIEPRPLPPSACKTAGQPAPFVFDPLQDLDRALARARKIRRETFDAAGRWIAARWLGLVLFVLIVGTLAAFHGHWSAKVWVETIR